MAKGELNFSEEETEKLFRDIHSGKVNLVKLPENLYNATGESLTEGVLDGFGVPQDINIQAPANDMIRSLKKSVYQFSAAKQFQFISDMQNFLFDEKGMIRPFKEFKGFADVINDQYNKNWLEAEYITSIGMSRGAADWERIDSEKELFPFLKYETLKDPRVRAEHAELNGIVRKSDDPFWDEFMPPNGWRCRCAVVQLESGRETDLSKIDIKENEPVFKGNAGKRGTVFNESHPYNKVPKPFKKHQENNFGLPLPADVKEVKKVDIASFKSHKELSDFSVLKYNIKKHDLSGIDLEIAKEQMSHFDELFKDYDVSDLVEISSKNMPNGTNASVFSLPTDKASILYLDNNYFSITREGKKRYIKEVDEIQLKKSKNHFVNVDKDKRSAQTITHEFAHIITGNSKSKLTDVVRQNQRSAFFKEAKKIKSKYTKQMNSNELKFIKSEISEKEYFDFKNKNFISEYAKTDLDEFVSESFTMYKLSSKTSPFANEIGDLIDKFYKKAAPVKKPKKVKFVPAKNLAQAEDVLKKNGITNDFTPYKHSNIDLETANEINEILLKINSKNNFKIESLLFKTDDEMQTAFAGFMPSANKIVINKDLLKDRTKFKRYYDQSVESKHFTKTKLSHLDYVLEHEVGHSKLTTDRGDDSFDRIKFLKVKKLWNKHNEIIKKDSNKSLSLYGETNMDEFIAESFVFSANGGKHEIANEVFNIIR